MKILATTALVYAIYLNNHQISLLIAAKDTASSPQIISQLNVNLICSYTFTIFIGLLAFYTIKSLF
jgi:hypothetical protein